MTLKIGVVGAGGVGSTLGGALLKNGITVKYGSRDPSSEKIQKVLSSQPGSTADTIHNVVDWADAIILATPAAHTDEAIRAAAASLGPGVDGKVLVDVTNPCSAFPGLEVRWDKGTSAGEVLQAALPKAIVYKAFNTLGLELMPHGDGSTIPGWTGGQMQMLMAGGPDKLDVAEQIVRGVGWVPAYVGPIRYARNLEAMAELWIHVALPPAGFTPVNWGRTFVWQAIGAPLK